VILEKAKEAHRAPEHFIRQFVSSESRVDGERRKRSVRQDGSDELKGARPCVRMQQMLGVVSHWHLAMLHEAHKQRRELHLLCGLYCIIEQTKDLEQQQQADGRRIRSLILVIFADQCHVPDHC
jgi:hypothetical protein